MSKKSDTANSKRKHSEMNIQTRSRSRSESVEKSNISHISKNSQKSLKGGLSLNNDKFSNNSIEQEKNFLNLNDSSIQSKSIISQEDGKNSNLSREESLKGSNLSKNFSSNFHNSQNQIFTDSLKDNTIEEENVNESESDEEPYYEVEAIVGKKIFRGKTQYHVKWKGYPSDQNTWEPIENLTNVMEMVENFEEMEKLFGTEQGRKKKKTGVTGTNTGTDAYSKYLKQSGLQSIVELSSATPKNKNSDITTSEKSSINLNSNFTLEKFDNTNKLHENSISNNDVIGLVPIKVIHARSKNDKLSFLMEWAAQPDGILPKPSLMSHEEIKRDHPYLLIEYYERRIRIVNPDEDIRSASETDK
jgi:hypothetical protein